jgi:hypothetical protein
LALEAGSDTGLKAVVKRSRRAGENPVDAVDGR